MAGDNTALLLQVSADIRGLEKAFDRALKKVKDNSRGMENAGNRLEKFFGKPSLANALDKVFDSTRFKILDSGVARVGLFGSALEALGPAGLVAAAGIGAVTAAFAGAREAAKFADEINDTANRLHITTDALQEYRYAIRLAGGETEGADQALEAFSVTLGRAAEGRAKALKSFKELFGQAFTKDDVKRLGDVDAALKAVTARIEGLSDIDKDTAVANFGLDGLKPLIEGGVTAMERLRQEAHKVGIVMDADLVRRGGELNDQFETVADVIKVQLMSALVDLGPVLVDLLQHMANLAKLAGDVADAFRDIEHKRASRLAELRDDFIARSKRPETFLFGGPEKDRERAARAQAALDKSNAENQPPPIKPTHELHDVSKTPKGPTGPRDDTDQRLESIKGELAASTRDFLQSQLGLTEDIDARAALERLIAAQEETQAIARLEKAKADLVDDKGFTGDRVRAMADLDLAIVAQQKAAEAKRDLIAREADWAAEDRADETRKQIRDAELANLEVAASIATTQAERNRIEAEILKIKQAELQHEKGKELSRLEQTGAISDEEGGRRNQAMLDTQRSERAQFVGDHLTPMQEYIRSISDADTAMQNFAVHGVQQVTDALADAITGATSFKAALSRVISSLLAEITRINLNGIVSGNAPNGAAFLSSLFGRGSSSGLTSYLQGAAAASPQLFANGTDSAPGGLAWVGERGRELVNLPRGAQVIPNDILRGLSKRSAASSNSYAPTLNINFHAPPGMSIADARRTGDQIGAAAMQQLAMARRRGF